MNKKILKFVSTFIILIFAIITNVIFGAQKLNLSDIFSNYENFSQIIFVKLRLPRMILCCVSGIFLASSGSILQLFFRNSLIESSVLSITSGSTLGAVLSIYFGNIILFNGLISSISIFAFIGSLMSGLLICLLSKLTNNSSIKLILCGSVLSSFYSAITSILLYANNEKLNAIYCWMLGSFSGRGWKEIQFIIIPSIIALTLIIICSNKLDLVSGGENVAESLGVNVMLLKTLIIITVSISTSISVCCGGTIGFIGLIAPHISGKLFGSKSKTLIIMSMIIGSILVLFADTLSRTIIAPTELPIGTITALMGSPFFISILLNKNGVKQ